MMKVRGIKSDGIPNTGLWLVPARIRARHYHAEGSIPWVTSLSVHRSLRHYSLFAFRVKMDKRLEVAHRGLLGFFFKEFIGDFDKSLDDFGIKM